MSRWSLLFSRRSRRSSGTTRSPGRQAAEPRGVRRTAVGAPPVEDIDGVLLVRSVEDDSFPMAALAEVAGALSVDEDIVTVMVGSGEGGGPDADLWFRLGALLDSLRAKGAGRVRLVLSGAGDDQPGRPCVARRIADAWELEVIAPDGAVLIAPGGVLFVQGGSGGGWWRFAPGEAPRKLGPRAPAPAWQEAVGRVPVRTEGGCVVDQIPAGVVIRPAEAPEPDPDDLCFAVPVDHGRPTVLVGALHAEDVAADEVAAVLAALPVAQRSRVRLAPGGRRDLLRLGHSVADMLGSELEVLTGLPLLADQAPFGTGPRPTLLDVEGKPSWQPFVSSVTCRPADAQGRVPAPRLVGSHPPAWLPGGTEPGTVRLTDRWQATVTRAGLALWERDGPRPPLAGAAVNPDACAIELGIPGQPLDASVLPALSQLLVGLGAATRARTTLLVRGRLTSGEGELRRMAAEHGVPSIRYVTAARPGTPGPPWPPARRAGTGAAPAAGTAAASQRAVTAGSQPAEPRVPVPDEESAEAGVTAGSATASGERGTVPGPAAPPVRSTTSSGPTGSIGTTSSASTAVAPPVRRPAATASASTAGSDAGVGAEPDGEIGGGGATAAGRSTHTSGASASAASSAAVGTSLGAPSRGGAGVSRAPEARTATGAGRGGDEPATPGGGDSTGAAERPDRAAAEPSSGGATGRGEGARRAQHAPGVTSLGAPASRGGAGPTGGRHPASEAGTATVGPSEEEPLTGGEAVAVVPDEPDRAGQVPVPEGVLAPGAAEPAPAPGPVQAREPMAEPAPAPVRARTPDPEPAPEPVRAPAPAPAPAPRPAPAPAPARAPAPRAAPLPFVQGHVSGAAERAAFRELAAAVWERHATAVSRVLTWMPALRGHELEAARIDLIAAHAYLTTEEGPLHHRELIRDIRTGEGRLLPYAGCLASALRRLPSYRGVALRGGDAVGPEPEVGTLLQDPAPVSALVRPTALPAGASVRYAIWSATGRKVRQLLGQSAGSPDAYDEIVFVPGTAFRVLGVRTAPAGSSVVLLRELPGNAATYMDGEQEPTPQDLKALTHLEEALAKELPTGEAGDWPERCSGPVGHAG
ncbi:hypothetical protein [Streptomyces sp. A5-4]|uniref:hypothetical protein n=1 Tax=Streptomyces sp. A5-4 TaxID=3384771 RepID=UPI003DA82F11